MILDTIAEATRRRVARQKATVSPEQIKKTAVAMNSQTGFPFEQALRKPDISFICEVKKASPSKGMIAANFPYLQIAGEYEAAGADAISVLTEPEFFLGSDAILVQINAAVQLPLLRKDFTVDDYQIYEAKTLGASAVLLICALMDSRTIRDRLSVCDELGLSALVEAHDEREVESALAAGARVIGVNNRNLQDFTVDIGNSIRLRKVVPAHVLFVAESGIKTPDDIAMLRQANVDAVLIGETLMSSTDKKELLAQLRGNAHDSN